MGQLGKGTEATIKVSGSPSRFRMTTPEEPATLSYIEKEAAHQTELRHHTTNVDQVKLTAVTAVRRVKYHLLAVGTDSGVRIAAHFSLVFGSRVELT